MSEVLGNYRLQNIMATGQNSQVWEVVEQVSHRHFAMKILLEARRNDAAQRRLLLHEASVGQQLAHPNVIKIVHVCKDPANPYFVMEYFPAGSLKLRLLRKQHDFINERIDGIAQKAATALAYINSSGWVHRDIKPDNILVNSAGEVRIIDFAITQRIQKPNFITKIIKQLRGTKTLAQGTRSYMSPEQILGLDLDGRADMYSFGCALYELTTGKPPFVGMTNHDLLSKHIKEKPLTPKIHVPELNDEFCDLVLRMLAKKRENRPRDFHEILMKLRSFRIYRTQPAARSSSE